MKRRDVLSSAGFAALAMALDSGRPALADEVTITLLHCNDVYEIAPKAGAGGFAPYMTLLEAERARNPHTITTFGGDLLSPSLMSGLTKGSQMIELTNAIGVQIAVLGNHEFDFGEAVFRARIAELKGPVLAANLFAALAGGPASAPVRSYRPRPRSLYLIASGPRHAIASWGRWSAEGRWVWRLKDRIDRAFIARHRRAAIVPV